MPQDNSTEGAMDDHAAGTLREYLRGEAGDFVLTVERLHAGFTVSLMDPSTLEDEVANAPTFAAAWLALAPRVFVRPEERPIVIVDKGTDPDWLDKTSVRPALEGSLSPEDQVMDLLRRAPGDRFGLQIALIEGRWIANLVGFNDASRPDNRGASFAEAWCARPQPTEPQ